MTSARKFFAQPHLVYSSYCTAHSTACLADLQTLTLKSSDKLMPFTSCAVSILVPQLRLLKSYYFGFMG